MLYTYGGFHDSTLSFIKSVTRAIDPATSLISAVEWRETLLSALAIAVQRWTARIMIARRGDILFPHRVGLSQWHWQIPRPLQYLAFPALAYAGPHCPSLLRHAGFECGAPGCPLARPYRPG